MRKDMKYFIWGCLALFVLLIYFLSPVLMPFLVAGVLAYLFDPIVNRLQSLRIPRVIGVITVFFLLIVLILLILFIVIPLLEEQVVILVNKIPDLMTWIQQIFFPWLHDKFGVEIDVSLEMLRNFFKGHLQQAGGFMAVAMKTVFSSGLVLFTWFTNLFLIPVVLFYLLRDWHSVLQGTANLLPRRFAPTAIQLFNECDEVLSAFLRGQLLVMLALGGMYTLGLAIIGLDVALLIGMISGLVSIVPYLGFIVGILSASIAAFVQFHDVIYILYVAIVFLIANAIESSVLTPWLVGDKIGLHPVAVIFAILAGGHLFGFVGILVALPVAAVLMVFLRYLLSRYIASNLYGNVVSNGEHP